MNISKIVDRTKILMGIGVGPDAAAWRATAIYGVPDNERLAVVRAVLSEIKARKQNAAKGKGKRRLKKEARDERRRGQTTMK